MNDEGGPSISFTLTEEDVIRFLRYHSLTENRCWIWLTYGAAILLTGWASGKDGGLWLGLGFAAFTALLMPLLWRWSLRQNARFWMRANPSLTRTSLFEISPKGVRETGSWGEATMEWSAYHRVAATPDAILLYRSRHLAEVIPRRAFPTPDAAEAFLEAARRWHVASLESERGPGR
jgi:hypothetical protein